MNENLLDLVKSFDTDFSLTNQIFSKFDNKKILVACSGGADSIALAVICKSFDLEIALCYIDHGINPDTVQCEVIVKNLSQMLDIPFFSKHLNMGNDIKSNIEATARQLRYENLEEVRKTHGYDLIATAHHQDDLVETYLINLLRGSGSGISSLKQDRDFIIRPLLHWRKETLIELVTRCEIEYFNDEMNYDNRFVRNRIRHELIPLLNDIAQRDVTPLIARSSRILQNDNDFLNRLAKQTWPSDNASTKDLQSLDPVLQIHALRAWIEGYPPSEEEMDRILKVVNHEILSTQISGDRTIWRRGAVLYQDVTSKRV